jgi:hypothetical protein
MTQGKTAGTHDFEGACAPGSMTFCQWDTFSVGIFEWVPKSSGRGSKRGKVKVRVKGSTSDPDSVAAKAREIVAALDAGAYIGPKTVNV